METPVAILPGRASFLSETALNNECAVKYTTPSHLKQIFAQCKSGVKFVFEGEHTTPDSERIYRFKYAKVNLDESLEEIGLWNQAGSVVKFKTKKV